MGFLFLRENLVCGTYLPQPLLIKEGRKKTLLIEEGLGR
jgi:hypothetical protein